MSGSGGGGVEGGAGRPDREEGPAPAGRPPFRVRDHIGVISGVFLGVVVLAFLVLLAFAGDPSALAILVVVIVGIALIALGAQMRGSRPQGRSGPPAH